MNSRELSETVIAGIITYNPEIDTLKKNIQSLIKQKIPVIIVDNASEAVKSISKMLEVDFSGYNIILIKNNVNKGIAEALNQAMEYALDHNFDWVLTMDQDSLCPSDYLKSMSKFFNVEPNIAIVAPLIVDRKVGVVGHNPNGNYGFVRTCITSGAITNVRCWERVGRFDSKMFIDSVDFEFCYRLRKEGFRILQTSKVKLIHSLGNGKTINLMGFKIRNNEHNAFRCYYIAQNNIYYPLKHHLWLYLIRGNIRNIRNAVVIVLFENNKMEKLKALSKGWVNGYLLRIRG